MTYWMLNAIFLVAVLITVVAAALVARRTRTAGISWRAVAFTALILIVLTALFDNVMIAIGLVDYNPAVTHPARLGVAPLEDFSYTVAAVLLLPAIWVLAARKTQNHDHGDNGQIAITEES